MTILIDDAGRMCLVGGMVVGVYREETDAFVHGIVEPHFFQGDAFATGAYLVEVANQVAACFEQLGVGKDELIVVPGKRTMSRVHTWLEENGYILNKGQVAGQIRVELAHALQAYLFDLGFEIDYEALTNAMQKRRFWWRQIKWLKGGNPERSGSVRPRAEQCKTGWPTFDIWANHPYSRAIQKIRASKLRWQDADRESENDDLD